MTSSFASTPPRIVIIGGGFSGAVLALELLNNGGDFRSLTIVESRAKIGRGLAYSTDHSTHLLNSRAAAMSVAGERSDFVDWLAARDPAQPSFASRKTYGEYVSQRFEEALRRTSRVRVVRDRAVAVRESEEGACVELESGARIDADVVVLATGHQPPATPREIECANLGELYVANPWRPGALNAVPEKGDILLLGTGMTMVDVVLALAEKERDGRIIALSRRGLTPRTHAPKAANHAPLRLPEKLCDALHELRWQSDVAEAHGRSWRDIFDELRPLLPQIWQSLPRDTQRRFLRHARPYWDAHRHRLAPTIAARFDDLKQNGEIDVRAGKIERVEKEGDVARVIYRPRGAAQSKTLTVSSIINCTGADPDVSRAADPLLQGILRAGVARVHATGLGFDVSESGALISADGAASTRLYALGPITQGAFWECTAAPEIRARAATLAAVIAPPQESGANVATLAERRIARTERGANA